jgi:hypothetical protein
MDLACRTKADRKFKEEFLRVFSPACGVLPTLGELPITIRAALR